MAVAYMTTDARESTSTAHTQLFDASFLENPEIIRINRMPTQESILNIYAITITSA